MKLSEIKGEKVLDVISELVSPVANIAADPEASDLLKKKKLPEGMLPGQFMAQRIGTSVPKLIKGHKDDLVTILATLKDKGKEEYLKDLTVVTLINDAMDILNDELFAQFFTTAQTSEAGTHSGSVPENTEGKA